MSLLSRLFPAGAGTPAREAALLREIRAGGGRFERIVLTRNRRVMASVGDGGETLRIHEAFHDAPDDVLHALGRLFSSRSAAARDAAKAEVRAYLAARPAPAAPRAPRRRARTRPSDRPHIERLRAEFDRVNDLYFGGTLPEVPLRISGRMRRRNGHFSAEPLEIAIARQLIERGAPGEAERTMRHEMIHLWQFVAGRKPGHGKDFRRWARRLDVHPRATRAVRWIEPSEGAA